MIAKDARIVVTGGYGFLGSALIDKLKADGYSSVQTFSSQEFDLTYEPSCQLMLATLNPEVVIHLAARVGGIGANRKNPGSFAYDNLAMGMNIIECCKNYGVSKLVIAGTICAYPKHTPVPFHETDLWNGYPEETNAPYGLAKKMLLVLAQGYRQQYDCNFIYLLPVNLYGPGDHFSLENSHVIPAMIRKFDEAKEAGNVDVTLWGDGTPTREFLYVDDCAEAFVAAMEKFDKPQPLNIGTGSEINMFDLAKKIQSIVGHTGNIIWDASQPNGQPRRCLNVTAAKVHLDWTAKTDFDVGLLKTYEWYKANKGENIE